MREINEKEYEYLCKFTEDVFIYTSSFPKEYIITMARMIQIETFKLFMYCSNKKTPIIETEKQVGKIRILFRFAKELNILGFVKFVEFNKSLEKIFQSSLNYTSARVT